MLIPAVVVYLVLTFGIGIYAARKVRGSADFVVAGRSLPLAMNAATVFATWFGAETVLSVSASFANEGLRGVPGDPFGASACLILAAVLFARRFYRMELLTIGDFYRKRFGGFVEVGTSAAISLSYLGWTSAQLSALGLVLHVLSGGRLGLDGGIVIGGVLVLSYTLLGGMWSVALTDLMQSSVIVLGLGFVAVAVGDVAGGPAVVIQHAVDHGRFDMWPEDAATFWAMAGSVAAFALGSIPQQDVFQRMTSAKDEDTAVRGTITGGVAYFVFAFVPIYICYAGVVAFPELSELIAHEDPRVVQRMLPDLVLARTPVWTQVLFFGALLSAILSTASGALLAPTALFTENVLRPFAPQMDDKRFLLVLRLILVVFAGSALALALQSRSPLHEMVQNSYNVTLAGAFVPLLAGVWWKRSTNRGAIASVVLGIGAWLLADQRGEDALIPSNLIGLFASTVGMVAGSLLDRRPEV